jgi:hypothetical protein
MQAMSRRRPKQREPQAAAEMPVEPSTTDLKAAAEIRALNAEAAAREWRVLRSKLREGLSWTTAILAIASNQLNTGSASTSAAQSPHPAAPASSFSPAESDATPDVALSVSTLPKRVIQWNPHDPLAPILDRLLKQNDEETISVYRQALAELQSVLEAIRKGERFMLDDEEVLFFIAALQAAISDGLPDASQKKALKLLNRP